MGGGWASGDPVAWIEIVPVRPCYDGACEPPVWRSSSPASSSRSPRLGIAGALRGIPSRVGKIGTTAKEATLFHGGLLGDRTLSSASEYLPALELNFPKADAARIAERYLVSGFRDANEALARVVTLLAFTCPARAMDVPVSVGTSLASAVCDSSTDCRPRSCRRATPPHPRIQSARCVRRAETCATYLAPRPWRLGHGRDTLQRKVPRGLLFDLVSSSPGRLLFS